VIPEGESRLGVEGQLVQGTGLNLRGERVEERLERTKREMAGELGIDPATPYAELPQAVRQQIREKADIESFTEGGPGRDSLTPDQVRAFSFERWNEEKARLESELAARLPVLTGRARLQAIQQFKQERFSRSQALLGNLEREPARNEWDLVAEQYWGIEAPTDPSTGEADLNERDSLWEAVLVEADRLGVSRNYITGTGKGTFRGQRFANDQVRQAVEELERDLERLRPYWDAGKELLPRIQDRRMRDIWERYLTATGATMRRMERDNPALRQLISAQADLRQAMRVQDREIDALLIKWGYAQRPLTPEGVEAMQGNGGGQSIRGRLRSRLQGNTPAPSAPSAEVHRGGIRERLRNRLQQGNNLTPAGAR
jgi:hypothetical protein